MDKNGIGIKIKAMLMYIDIIQQHKIILNMRKLNHVSTFKKYYLFQTLAE